MYFFLIFYKNKLKAIQFNILKTKSTLDSFVFYERNSPFFEAALCFLKEKHADICFFRDLEELFLARFLYLWQLIAILVLGR